jgi:hydrogenase nickel incorporation protein HypA/HybF
MHELALCESVVQIVEDQARASRFTRVLSVRLEVGALACVEPDAMRFNFEVVSRGTVAEGARLDILSVPAQAWCPTCERRVEVSQLFAPCPVCDSDIWAATGGDELRVKELEVI